MEQPIINIRAEIAYASAYDPYGVEVDVKNRFMTMENYITYIRGKYPKYKINVTTSLTSTVMSGEDEVDPETGEIIKIRKNAFKRMFDRNTASCAHRGLTGSEFDSLRLYSASYMISNAVISVGVGLLFGKTALGIATIGLGTSLLYDVSTIKLRKKFIRRKLVR